MERLLRWVGWLDRREEIEHAVDENREAYLREQAAAADRLARVGLDLHALDAEVRAIRHDDHDGRRLHDR